jgi:hypothetical protein
MPIETTTSSKSEAVPQSPEHQTAPLSDRLAWTQLGLWLLWEIYRDAFG